GVVLAPADVVLVCGGPRERRRYLDMVLSLSVRGYVQALGRYRRALAQRIRASGSEAAAWEEVLAAAGADLVAARRTWTERWKERYAEYCEALGEALSREDVKTRSGSGMAYRTSVEGGAEALREALESSRARDRQLGRTTVGPHRDELRLTLGGRDLRTYGSAGQQRTAALALRLVEADTLQESDGPLVLALDDAFAELDEERSRNLGTLIGRFAAAGNQIVAAVPKRDEVPAVAGGLEVWRVNDGVVRTTGS
ncbi:MAG TPA: hypothetical protein VNL98_13155, partial [Gemmatimonadales bacterium]|nr:hypothetical protein [Gemmatimonadales bacterium]